MTRDLVPALLLCAVACAGLTLLLGLVTRAPRTLGFDVWIERLLYGRGVGAAWLFTIAGYARSLTALFVVTFGIEMILRLTPIATASLLATQVASQGAVSLVKSFFDRIRPANWLVRRERDSSFPSGHAATAIVTYAGLLILLWRSPAPAAVHLAISVPLAIFAVGIGWSRIALGAHYLSDVVGGYAFGAAWLCLWYALLRAYGV